MCAVTAAQRGHKVILFEKTGRVGGRLNPGSVPKIKFDVANYLNYLKGLCERTARDYDFELKLNTEATPKTLKDEGFDKVVVAVGTRDTNLKLPGYEKANCRQAVEVLDNPDLAKDAKKIVIVGAGVVGCETAYFLNKEHGKDITVIEMTPEIMNHTCTANRGYLLKYMEDAGIKLYNCTKLLSFEANGVRSCATGQRQSPTPTLHGIHCCLKMF
jgi:2-enoate reductase